MRVLIHHRTLRDFLFSDNKISEQIERIADPLIDGSLEIFISEYALTDIHREMIYGFEDSDKASENVLKLRSFFQVVPLVDKVRAKKFISVQSKTPLVQGTNLDSEAFEFCQANDISADIILSANHCFFKRFGLHCARIDHRLDSVLLRRKNNRDRLPIVIAGDFSDIWHIANSVKRLESINTLSTWHRKNEFHPDWLPIEEIPGLPKLKFLFRRKCISRAKIFSVRELCSEAQKKVILVASIKLSDESSFLYKIFFHLYPLENECELPRSLLFRILDENGHMCLQKLTSNEPEIWLEIEAKEDEKFSIFIGNERLSHREYFVV